MSTPTLLSQGNYGFAWRKVKPQLGVLAGMAVLMLIVSGVVNMATHKLGAIGMLVGLVVNTWLAAGYYKAAIKVHDGQTAEFGDLFSGSDVFAQVLIANLLMTVAMTVGMLLLFVPGCYALARLGFAPLLAVEANLSGLDALKESARLTKGRAWQTFSFFFLGGLILIAGAICLGVGLVVAMPVVFVALIHAVRWLRSHAGATLQPQAT